MKKTEERCKEIGNVIVCLHYLASEARKSKLEEVAKHLEAVIIKIAGMGREEYVAYLTNAIDNDKSVQAFIDTFCPVADDSLRFGLKELIHTGSGGTWQKSRIQK